MDPGHGHPLWTLAVTIECLYGCSLPTFATGPTFAAGPLVAAGPNIPNIPHIQIFEELN